MWYRRSVGAERKIRLESEVRLDPFSSAKISIWVYDLEVRRDDSTR